MPPKPKQRVSHSELASFRLCNRQWYLTYREGWEPPEKGPARARGIAWHELLATHYKGEEVDPADWFFQADGSQSEEQELLQWMFEGYLQYYGTKDREWKVLHVEYKLEGLLPNLKGLPSEVTDVAVLDLIVKDKRGGLWIIDHKTAKDLPNEKKLELEDQWGQYVWIMRQLGRPVQGIIANVARTLRYKDPSKPQPLEERFQRYLLYRTDVELDEIAREAYVTSKKMAKVKTKEQAERHTGEHCLYRCSFGETCLAARKGVDEEEYMRAKGFRRRGE